MFAFLCIHVDVFVRECIDGIIVQMRGWDSSVQQNMLVSWGLPSQYSAPHKIEGGGGVEVLQLHTETV